MKNLRLHIALLSFLIAARAIAQPNPLTELQNRMLGYKHLSIQVYNPSTNDTILSHGNSVFSLVAENKFINEEFSFPLFNRTISGNAYITYSAAHKRFELVRIDNFSKSMVILNGNWDDSLHSSITFIPINNYPQWGYSPQLNLKWKYTFNNNNILIKEIFLSDSGGYTLSSTYIYTNSISNNATSVDWKSKNIKTNDGNIFYQTIGVGQPILLVNGGPGWSSNHIMPFAEMLGKLSCQVFIYDQRGTVKSFLNKPDSSSISLQKITDDIELIRWDLSIIKWLVIGHSFGEMLAMNYSTQYSGFISKMILIAPGGMNLNFLESYQSSLNARLSKQNIDNINYWTQQTETNTGIASMNIIYNTLPAFLYNDSLVNSMMDFIDTTTWNLQTASLVWNDLSKINFDISSKLKSFQKPVLVIQGNQDALGNAHATEISNALPNAQLQFINNAAHILWAD